MPNCQLNDLETSKYLIEENNINKLEDFETIIKKRLKMKKEDDLFFYLNGKKRLTYNKDKKLRDIYETYKEKDGFLYLAYTDKELESCCCISF